MLKLTLLATRADAERIEARLADWQAPEPSAVSRFDAAPGQQTVEAYFELAPSDSEIACMIDGQPVLVPPLVEMLTDENWVARVEATLSPVRAGRFVVHGPHDRGKVGGEPFAIEIEAGGAFGTAHHPTTRGCLVAIDRLLADWSPAHAFDLGCGSGVLAIAIAKMIRRPLVLASDIDARSAEIAAENFANNRVAAWTEAFAAAGFEHPRLTAAGQFDLVVANILAEPLVTLAPAIRRSLAPAARVVLSGLLDDQAATVIDAYVASGLDLRDSISLDGWSTLVFAAPAERPG